MRQCLPGLTVQIGGPAPDTSYAVIGFTPGEALAKYRGADWVHISGAGADGMLRALKDADMQPTLMTRTVGQMGRQIGEFVLSYWLADLQKHQLRAALQAERRWDSGVAAPQMIKDRSALIIGTGGIGSGVACVLSAMGVTCIGASRSGQLSAGFDHGLCLDALPDAMNDIDLIVGALPLTPNTNGLIGRDLFDRMDRALFINVGRGPTAYIPDILTALEKEHLRHAVLDVVPREPLPREDPLWSHPGVTITPHVSGLTLPDDAANAFVAAYRALEKGESPDLIVDPETGY